MTYSEREEKNEKERAANTNSNLKKCQKMERRVTFLYIRIILKKVSVYFHLPMFYTQ